MFWWYVESKRAVSLLSDVGNVSDYPIVDCSHVSLVWSASLKMMLYFKFVLKKKLSAFCLNLHYGGSKIHHCYAVCSMHAYGKVQF